MEGNKKYYFTEKSKPSILNSIIDNNATLRDPITIANAFNKYFASIALDIKYLTKSSIKYPKKQFFDFLPPTNSDSFFISPTDCNEVSNIISSLNNLKSVGPNSIPTNILKFLNKNISLFNLSLSSGIFPNILKTSKIMPLHKKDSKLNCSNYRPISLLLIKFLKESCIIGFKHSLKKTNLFTFSTLVSDKSIRPFHALIYLTESIKKQSDDGNYG